MPTFEEYQRGAQAAYDAETIRADTAEARIATVSAQCDTLSGELAEAKARIIALEAELATPPATPTEPAPAKKPPAILDERFTNGVDWNRFFSDGNPSAPRDRFAPTAEGLKVIWICGNPTGTSRSEIGIRAVAGGGDTARREPVGSERWYAIDFVIPEAYKLDDAEKDHKRVLWQCHQVSGENPPLSLELRNGTFRLVRSVGGVIKELLDPDTDPDGLPCVKGAVNRLIVHVLWHPVTGWVDSWFNGVKKPRFSGPTCYSGTEGLQTKCGSYQPGSKTGDFPLNYRIEHLVKRLAIGDASNKMEDFA